MKKVIAMFAIAALVACGGGASTEVAPDTAAQVVDTAKATTTDSTATDDAVKPAKEEPEAVK